MKFIRSNEVVTANRQWQSGDLQAYAEAGEVPRLLIPRTLEAAAKPDVRSYTAAARREFDTVRAMAGRVIGANTIRLDQLVEVVTAPAADLVHIVRDANDDPAYSAILTMWYGREGAAAFDAIASEVGPEKDIDKMNPAFAELNGTRPLPITSRAVVESLDHHDLWSEDFMYAVQGSRGRTVGTGVTMALRKLHGDNFDKRVKMANHTDGPDAFAKAVAQADVVLMLAGQDHALRPEMVTPRLKGALGVGNDIHPETYQTLGDVLFTPPPMDPRYMALGIWTSSKVVTATFAAHAMQHQLVGAARV